MATHSPALVPLLLGLATLLGAAADPPRPVRVQTVSLSPSALPLTVSGTVQARTQADLAFRVGGKVVSRPVEVGDHVAAGQVLATLDPADLRFSEQVAQAAVASAQADDNNAAADLRRYQELGRNSPAYLPSDYDKRVSAARMADARLIQAQRQLALAVNQRAYGQLVADADGVLTALPIQVGQVVASGQTAATLAHTGEIEVVADVPENRLPDVRAARQVSIALWALPGTALQGRVREVGALADAASRTFVVKISVLDAPAALLSLGMTATVRFGGAAPDVALLPPGALTDQAGQPAVWVLDPAAHTAALRRIEVASYRDDGSVAVRAGLQPGEQVITAGVEQLQPGMALTAWAGAQR